MSKYKTCRECGGGLNWNGQTYGGNECGCDTGYCLICCDCDAPTAGPTPAATEGIE